MNFTVTNPTPVINSIDPAQVLAGGGNFALTVTGSGFVPGSIVRVNGADRVTSFVSTNQLTGAITAADIAAGGMLTITVFNGAPGGGSSIGPPSRRRIARTRSISSRTENGLVT